jgi:putative ABC transport system permease protein
MMPAPPRLLTRVLLAVSPRGDECAGDLHEEFVDLAGRRGRLRAVGWYAAQVASVAVRAGIERNRLAREARRAQRLHAPGDSLMTSLAVDVRQALRTLMKRPALSALVVMTLALGLGANAAIFQVIDALLIRPFTLKDVDRIVMVAQTGPDVGIDTQETVAPANFLDWKRQTDVFDALAAFEWWDVNLSSTTEAERVPGFAVSANFFDVLGVQPALGRAFTPDEEIHGNHRRAILSYGLWQRRFGADRAIVGQTVLIDAEPYEVVGVAPEGFNFPLGTEVWGPLALTTEEAQTRNDRYLTVLGRLTTGRSLEDAQAQIAVVADRLAHQYPEANRGRGARVLTLSQGMRDQGLGPIAMLWQASAAFVLLIACANIANLLLARGAERQRELAVRAALGASRGRMVRELLVESAVLAFAAVPAALGVAWLGIRLIHGNLPPALVRFVEGWHTMDVDGRLVLFTIALAAITSVIFGMLPALRASRPALVDTLKDGSRGATAGRQRQRLRQALVVVEVALALPLLVGSGLSVIGAQRFLNGYQGYDPNGLLKMHAVLPEAAYGEPEARRRFVENAVTELGRLPGVTGVGIANALPTSGGNAGRWIEVEGQPAPDPANRPVIDFRAVSPSFMDTMRLPMVRGRGLTTADSADSLAVVVISRSAAQRFFGESDPIGRRIRLGAAERPWLTIVGISGDHIHNWFGRRNAPTAYVPYAQSPTLNVAFVLRSDGDLSSLIEPARQAIRRVDAAQPVFDAASMNDALAVRTIGLQYVAAIMAVFGGLALLLAAVGVYSLMAFIVMQRTHEIGVRIALGATRRDVLRLTVRQAASMTLVGILIGLGLSAGVGRALDTVLSGSTGNDPRVALSFAAVLLASALAAGYIPARRATAIDPVIALRE